MATNHLKQFEQLFRELFKPLCSFALKYTRDIDEAKGLVQEAFISVWEKMETLPPDTHYRSYLYTAVRNRCLNYLRDRKKTVDLSDVSELLLPQVEGQTPEARELEITIEKAINSLPEKCREVFELSRFADLKYIQIAEKMGISVKTVEAQMSKALHALRDRLGGFLVLLLLINWR